MGLCGKILVVVGCRGGLFEKKAMIFLSLVSLLVLFLQWVCHQCVEKVLQRCLACFMGNAIGNRRTLSTTEAAGSKCIAYCSGRRQMGVLLLWPENFKKEVCNTSCNIPDISLASSSNNCCTMSRNIAANRGVT